MLVRAVLLLEKTVSVAVMLLVVRVAVTLLDVRCRVFSGYIKEVDEKPSATSWGPKMTFANLMAEHSNGGGRQLYLFLYY